MKRTTIAIRTGSIAVHEDGAYIEARGPRIVAIVVNMKSKRPGFDSTGHLHASPAVWLERTEETLRPTRLKRDTIVSFTEFPGWRVFNAEAGKNLLRVTLIKETFPGPQL